MPNDVNSNGVRDDVEAYINTKSYAAFGKQSLLQVARALQVAQTVDTSNATALNAAALATTRAVNCVFSRATGITDPLPDEILRLQSITANTKERLSAYMRYNKALDGTVSSIPAGDTCE